MTYEAWEAGVPDSIKKDPLWKMAVYRKALFLGDIAWPDATRLVRDKRTTSLADQLYRAVGSIDANIAEGYSKSSRKDRVRFYEYSLGSARESRGWYWKSRHVLGDKVANHRLELIAELIRLLLAMIRHPNDQTFG
jgi:four helix bundle protein